MLYHHSAYNRHLNSHYNQDKLNQLTYHCHHRHRAGHPRFRPSAYHYLYHHISGHSHHFLLYGHHHPRQPPRLLHVAALDLALEDRHERRGQRAFPEELARHVGYREREGERRLLDACVDQPGLEHLPREPEHAREHCERPDGKHVSQCLRSGHRLLFFRLSSSRRCRRSRA